MPFIDPVRILPVGHQVIDQAHGDLVERINKIYEMWQTRQPAEQLALECSLLLRAFGRHFAEEEALVESLGFAAIDAHRQRHQELLADITVKVHRLCNKAEPYCETIVDVFSAIDQLLYEHEIVDDQEFWYLFQDTAETTLFSSAILAIDETLYTGLIALDQQHYEVVVLVNRLGGLLAIEAPKAVIISALRVRPERSLFFTEPSNHKSNGCEFEEGKRLSAQALPILGEATASSEPSECALDDPAPG